jgi:CRP-like cAMP-binding protein
METNGKPRNHFLRNLSENDLALLAPLITINILPAGKALETSTRPTEFVYFVEKGLVSVVVSDRQYKIEAGLIGREGCTGSSLVMGMEISPYDMFVQVSGQGWRIPARDLLDAMNISVTLRAKLILHAHMQSVQMAFTVLANSKYTLIERLARRLLMVADRTDDERVMLTHNLLATMLGVRRAGVTSALNALELKDIITSKRGCVSILNRAQLIDVANGSYGDAEAEFRKYFPNEAVPSFSNAGGDQLKPLFLDHCGAS